MATLAYICDQPTDRDHISWMWDDLLPQRDPAFVFLLEGDLVLTLEETWNRRPGTMPTSPRAHEWVCRRLFRVTKSEETGDAILFDADLVDVLSPPTGSPRHSVFRDEFIEVHNWLPEVGTIFKRFPLFVWTWLRDARGVPLPDVGFRSRE